MHLRMMTVRLNEEWAGFADCAGEAVMNALQMSGVGLFLTLNLLGQNMFV